MILYHKLPIKEKFKLWFYTLFYHSSFSLDYCVDVFIEPCFWFVDKFTKYLGKCFVAIVCCIVGFVAFTAQTLGGPFWYRRSPTFAVCLHVFGYWLLINIIHNYVHAAYVSPGEPTDTRRIGKSGVTVCKMCVSPKPPRTHHCSVCKKCYLAMDHHCPWVNNCIGHFNHRYFYLTACYILLGVVFVMIFGAELAWRQIFMGEDVLPFPSSSKVAQALSEAARYPGPVHVPDEDNDHEQLLFGNGALSVIALMLGIPQTRAQYDRAFAKTELCFGIMASRIVIKSMIYMAGFLCIGASICLGGLVYWHGTLISNGETSIERHINRTARKKQENYVNLYDLGFRRNWYVFLGIDKPGMSIWRHVLLPSRHPPCGDGYDWSHILKYTMPRKLSE